MFRKYAPPYSTRSTASDRLILRQGLVARHLQLGHSPQEIIVTLARAVLREDAGFHAYQMLEAGVRQFTARGNTDAGQHVLIAVTRYDVACLGRAARLPPSFVGKQLCRP
jgi:hypothetical protein